VPLKKLNQLLRKIKYLAIVFGLAAFTTPQQNDLVELTGFLYGRSEQKFRQQDKNQLYVLKPNTRGIIEKTEKLPSGNYGLCIKIQNAADSINLPKNNQCVWVYYHQSNPALKLYSVSKNTVEKENLLKSWAQDNKKVILKNEKDVAKAQAAVTTREVQAIAKPQFASQSQVRAADQAIEKAEAARAAQQIENINKNMSVALSNDYKECKNCTQSQLSAYENCSLRKGSDYLEPALQQILSQSPLSSFYQSSQKEVIRSECIQRNLQQFNLQSSFFKQCSPQQSQGGKPVARACVSENYVNLTAKSFNLVADCMGDYVAGSATGKNQAALSIFAFMAQESGMHVNARSQTGAGGPGQMTGGAIEAVNKNLRNIKNHLNQNSNPLCQSVLGKVLEKPLTTQADACDRRALNQDNPMKNIAYAFAYQEISRRILTDRLFDDSLFGRVLSEQLPAEEKDRLMMELSAWAHNTGPAGMERPLSFLLRYYVGRNIKVANRADIDKLFVDLRSFMQSHPHPANSSRGRYLETANYYANIQKRMKNISEEPRLCLAN
jgi:hypothetical protein